MPWTAPGGGTAQSAVSGGSPLRPGPDLSTGASTAVFRDEQDGHRCTGLELGPMLDAVPCARGHARNVLREWAIRADAADAVELVVSELVTNAVQAAQRLSAPIPLPVWLRLTDQAACVLVEVADGGPGAPLVHQPESDGDSGRGLVLVAAVSAGWGYYASDGIWKVVWATVALDRADDGITQRIENDFPGRTVTHDAGGWSATAPGCERIWAPTHQALRTLLSFAAG
jgi:anti-sigma regulatory factor (Ser/Thr protein kinase)